MWRVKNIFFLTCWASLILACSGGEKNTYEGILTTKVVKSGSGETVGTGADKVAVTMTKSGNDYASLKFKTITDGKIKSELDYCTVELLKLGDDWTEKSSKECDVEGAKMAILNGKVNVREKELSFDIEAVQYGTGSSNKYNFKGKEK